MDTGTKSEALPIGPLMIEHRLIERMVALLEKESSKMRAGEKIREDFIAAAVDFLGFYADRSHHGKEEDILFRELENKALSAADKEMIGGLKRDHARARELVARLSAGTGRPEALRADMDKLTALYRAHIIKEDKQFFIPVMQYFNKEEQNAMLYQFREFDRGLIHEKYGSIVERFERK